MTTTHAEFPGTHMIVLPGGGYAEHAAHEAEPVARWLGEIGVQASVFRYPLNVRHPVPLDALRAEIGRRRAASPQVRQSTSLDALVTPQSPPFFCWHTAEDLYVPPEHTYRFASALAASGVPHAVHVFAHGPHGLGLAQDAGEAAIWTTLANAWIQEQAARPE
jgi:Prolyl oligopeptidase family